MSRTVDAIAKGLAKGSGKKMAAISLRVPERLRKDLEAVAEGHEVSLNALIVAILQRALEEEP